MKIPILNAKLKLTRCRGCDQPTLVVKQGLCPLCWLIEGEADDE